MTGEVCAELASSSVVVIVVVVVVGEGCVLALSEPLSIGDWQKGHCRGLWTGGEGRTRIGRGGRGEG